MIVYSGDEECDDDVTSGPANILGDEGDDDGEEEDEERAPRRRGQVVFCDPEVHQHLRAHPEDLLRLRPWREMEQDIGECPGCFTTVHVDWSPERRRAEGLPTQALEEGAA